jgi:PIN domain nuclease of toxin-antitoxin system
VSWLLLDTHAWVWSVQEETRRIGRLTRQLLSRAEARDAIRVSPISLFEVTALHALGRLRLALPPDQWIRDGLVRGGVRIAEFSPSVAIDAGAIPRTALADPLDRMLVATARQLGATFLTADTRILAYARETGNVRVHDASR